jgi:adenylate cyclase
VRLLDRLSDLGARPEDPRDERLRHGTLIFASVLIALISLIWVATYFAYDYPTSAAIPALYQLTTVVGLVVLARTRRFGVFRTTQLLAFLVLPALLRASLDGFVASSAMILWAIFTPLAALDFILRSKGITTIVLGGFLTNCCVESTMRAAWTRPGCWTTRSASDPHR